MPEIADLAGVKLNTIAMWRIRHRGGGTPLPEDDDNLCGRPVWRLERVIAWLELTAVRTTSSAGAPSVRPVRTVARQAPASASSTNAADPAGTIGATGLAQEGGSVSVSVASPLPASMSRSTSAAFASR
jgi:hypothetical protein